MERKQDSQEGKRCSNISINGDDNHDHHDHEGLCLLKREIACHSLYSLLVQSHLNCLNISLSPSLSLPSYDKNMGKMESSEDVMKNPSPLPNHQHDPSELDQFMEAYCVTLKKLKESMEEPQQESMAFINLMYSQLDDLLPDIPSTRGS